MLNEALFVGPAHPHWSGAALIGASGALMGVGSLQMNQETADGRPALINMCVPIELLPPIVDDLSRGRVFRLPRPWLGVYCQDVDGAVVVMDVARGGPADRADVRRGDRILAVDGEPVADLAEVYGKLWFLGEAGIVVPLRLKRGRDVLDLEIATVDRASRLKKRRFN
jgi:S1-C subfamily serine protease